MTIATKGEALATVVGIETDLADAAALLEIMEKKARELLEALGGRLTLSDNLAWDTRLLLSLIEHGMDGYLPLWRPWLPKASLIKPMPDGGI